jgi:hypothetical protein
LEIEITVDARKRKSQRNPFDWIYGVVVKANNIEKGLVLDLSGQQFQIPAKTRIEEKWIAMLTVVVTTVVQQLGLRHADRFKLYVCQELTCSIPKKQATLIAAVAEMVQVPPLSVSAEFVTRKGSKSRLALAERYNKAHRNAKKEKADVHCNPQEVKRALRFVHRIWHRS